MEVDVEKYFSYFEACALCGHRCLVNRIEGERGECDAGVEIKISSFGPHYGEEPELVGRFGSGTVFFTNCNLACQFCQNYDISQEGKGVIIDAEGLVRVMLDLQKRGCHNINWVSPTHLVPALLPALEEARKRGLTIPLVYNSGGYDSLETLELLRGKVEIYMPDAKYGDSGAALKYSGAENYWEVCRLALEQMHSQVGDLVTENGIAIKGLLVRHLVLPDDIASSMEVFKYLSEKISRDTYINIMDQYRPCYRAGKYPELNSTITQEEFRAAVMLARDFGLHRGFTDYWEDYATR